MNVFQTKRFCSKLKTACYTKSYQCFQNNLVTFRDRGAIFGLRGPNAGLPRGRERAGEKINVAVFKRCSF